MDNIDEITNRFQALTIRPRKRSNCSVPKLTSGLPNELWAIIFGYLEGKNLKTVRCVCKCFSLLAARPLFDKVYVSPHRINMDVFTKIAQHPTLSLHPRVLVNQIPRFQKNYSLRLYFACLCNQLRLYLGQVPDKNQLFDEERQELLRVAANYDSRRGLLESDYERSSLRTVQQSYKRYIDEALEQDHFDKSGEYLASLCLGLAKLINVRKVEFGTSWENFKFKDIDRSIELLDLSFSPSPLARSWNLFQLRPEYQSVWQHQDFDNMVSSFSLTGRSMHQVNFDIPSSSVPWRMFDPNSEISRTFRQHGNCAMSRLERLTIQIATCDPKLSYRQSQKQNISVDLLRKALSGMRKLRYLQLFISKLGPLPILRLSEIFSENTFPALQTLKLYSIAGSEIQISNFLRAQPQLCNLFLAEFNLEEGDWVDLVDEMQRSLHLNSMCLLVPLQNENHVAWNGRVHKIEEYILHGGKNPLRALE